MSIESVLVVGGKGQMGALFAARCREAGLTVLDLDRPLTGAALRGAVPQVDLVLLAVPVPAVEEVAARCAELMRPPQILADLASVKIVPMAGMLAAYAGPVVGTHPLFGPEPPEEARVAVMPGRAANAEDREACDEVQEFMRRLGFAPFLSSPEEHDRAVAMIQGLNFVTTVSYLAALARQEGISRYLTPSFHRRLDSAEKMLTTDAELFTTLFETNPFGQDAVRHFRNFLHIAAGGDVDLLVHRAQWWWSEEADDEKHGK